MLLTLLSCVLSQFCPKDLHCLSFASCWFILHAKTSKLLILKRGNLGKHVLTVSVEEHPQPDGLMWEAIRPQLLQDKPVFRLCLYGQDLWRVRWKREKPTKPSLLHVYYWAWRRQFSVNVLPPQIYSYSTVLATGMELIHGSYRGSSHQTLHYGQSQQGVITREFPLREIH